MRVIERFCRWLACGAFGCGPFRIEQEEGYVLTRCKACRQPRWIGLRSAFPDETGVLSVAEDGTPRFQKADEYLKATASKSRVA